MARPGAGDGLVVDNITRPNENAESYYVNLDGKFQLTDNLTIKAQIGYTHGVGEHAQQPSFEVDGAHRHLLRPVRQRLGGDPDRHQSAEPGRPLQRLGLERDLHLGRQGILRQGSTATTRSTTACSRTCCSAFASPITPARWMAGTAAARSAPTGPCSDVTDHAVLGHQSRALSQRLQCRRARHSWPAAPDRRQSRTSSPRSSTPFPTGCTGRSRRSHTPQNYYWLGAFKVHEDDYAGYVMAKVGGDGWRGNFGLRIVDTDENAFVNVSDLDRATPRSSRVRPYGPYFIDHVTHNYVDILPSINLTFDLQKNLLPAGVGGGDHVAARLQRPGRHGLAHRPHPHRQRRQPEPQADQGGGL